MTVGDRLTSSNRSMGLTWTSTSTVTAADPGRCFAFAVNGTEHHPTALDLRPDAGAARRHPMRYTVVLDDGPSMFDAVSGGGPPRRAGCRDPSARQPRRGHAAPARPTRSHASSPSPTARQARQDRS